MRLNPLLLKIQTLILFCSGALPGQSSDTLFQVRDQDGNTWLRHQTLLVEPAHPPVSTGGEVPLPLLGKKRVTVGGLHPGDTVAISIANKAGIPFRRLEWLSGTAVISEVENSAVFQHQAVCTTSDKITLAITPVPGLVAQTAIVQVRKAPAQMDTVWLRSDSLLTVHPGAERDTVWIKTSQRTGNLNPVVLDWKRDLAGNFRQTGTMVVENKPGVRTRLVPAGPHQLPGGYKTRRIPYTDFLPDDTLSIQVTAQGKAPLAAVYLFDQEGNTLNTMFETPLFADTLVIRDDTLLLLELRGKLGLKRRFAQVEVVRTRPVASDSFYLVVDSFFTIQTNTLYDTVLVSLADDSLSVTPIWNIESQPYAEQKVEIPLMLPDGHQLEWVAYWIGIGDACLQAWDVLEPSVPPDWSKPGVPVALGAYGLGQSVVLPLISTSDITAAFARTAAKPLRVASTPLKGLPNGQNAGILKPGQIENFSVGKTNPLTKLPGRVFIARFLNASTVNTHPVRIRLAGYYRIMLSRTEEILFSHSKTYKLPVTP